MPLPFIIAGAIGAALLGINKSMEASNNNSMADSIISNAQDKYSSAEYSLDNARSQCNTAICNLGNLKLNIASKTLVESNTVFNRIKKNLQVSKVKIAKAELQNFEKYTLPIVNQVGMNARGVLAAGGSGISAAAGAYGLATTVGVASTGTAISALSGVAATNATLAWFGGGSIAAGGLGMTAGAAVLGGIALAPMLLIGGFASASAAQKRLTEAESYSAKVDVAVSQMQTVTEVSNRITKEVEKLIYVLNKLNELLKSCLEKLKITAVKIEAGGKAEESEMRVLYSAVLLIKAIKKLLSDNLLNANGDIDEEVKQSTAHAESLTGQDIANCNVISVLVSGKKIKTPSKLIQPGPSSDIYFWISDRKISRGGAFWKLIKYSIIAFLFYYALSSLFGYFKKSNASSINTDHVTGLITIEGTLNGCGGFEVIHECGINSFGADFFVSRTSTPQLLLDKLSDNKLLGKKIKIVGKFESDSKSELISKLYAEQIKKEKIEIFKKLDRSFIKADQIEIVQ